MKLREPSPTTSLEPDTTNAQTARSPGQLALWQLNLLRVGSLVMGVGLAFGGSTTGDQPGVGCSVVVVVVIAPLAAPGTVHFRRKTSHLRTG
jgi:hypothetical protein